MALVTTVGSASADSYADEAFATAFFTSLGILSEWTTYAADDEEMLRRAMGELEARDYMGGRANNDAATGVYQALEFPRKVTFYLGAMSATDGTIWTDTRGRRYTDDEVPTPIKRAQCWLAMAAGVDEYRLANEPDEVSEIRTGRVTLKMKDSGLVLRAKRARLEAYRLLRPFLASENGRVQRA